MERKDISENDKWKLEDMYQNIDEYNKDIDHINTIANKLVDYKEKILTNDKNLLEVLQLNEQLEILVSKLYVYINMKLHEDTRISKYQELSGNLDIILAEINEKTSFIIPEILEGEYNLIKEYISHNSKLKRFEFLLENMFNQKEHILSKNIEEIMSRTGIILNSPDTMFCMLNDADITFENIKDESGKSVNLTKSNYHNFITSKNRRVRRGAFKTFFKKYKELNNTFASILNSSLQSTNFLTKTRKYDEPINLYLDSDKIDTGIYYDLISRVNTNLDKMYEYNKMRKEKLKLNNLHMYDIKVKLTEENDIHYDFNDAKELTLNALKLLGEDYINNLNNAFNSRWIDIYENSGKRSGAYAWGCYTTHPYVLMNYQYKYKDVSTLAHEIGHAMHKFYSINNQDYHYSDNVIFVAEIASTVNEILLNFYMLNNTKDINLKKSIINELLDDIKNTIYRQTMFAEFELDIHNRSYNGETLSAEKLNNIYYDLVKKYHGSNVVCDEDIKYEWSYIPHFYSPFYVYQYATGFSIAYAIADKIFNGDKDMLNKYLEFLKNGSNDYPTNLVKKMGIDIPNSVDLVLNKFGDLINTYNNIDKE